MEAELVQQGGMDVCDIVGIFHGMEPEFIGGAMDLAALDSSPSHPDGKSEWVMVSTIGILGSRGASEFGGENDERFIQQPPAFQILNQAGNWLVDLSGQ